MIENIIAKAYCQNGKVIKCSLCGKDAVMGLIGNESSIHRCSEHPITSTHEEKFIYRDSDGSVHNIIF